VWFVQVEILEAKTSGFEYVGIAAAEPGGEACADLGEELGLVVAALQRAGFAVAVAVAVSVVVVVVVVAAVAVVAVAVAVVVAAVAAAVVDTWDLGSWSKNEGSTQV